MSCFHTLFSLATLHPNFFHLMFLFYETKSSQETDFLSECSFSSFAMFILIDYYFSVCLFLTKLNNLIGCQSELFKFNCSNFLLL